MTVDELIKALREHPGDLRVYVRGYEAGVEDVHTVEEVRVHRNVHVEEYYGAHEILDEDDHAYLVTGRAPATAEPGLFLAEDPDRG